jgi:hypothetical protein
MISKQQKEWNWKQKKNRKKNFSIVVCGNCQHLDEISEQSSRKPSLWRDPVLVIFHCKGLLTLPAF